jgi:malonyl-CoA O-methyltransferase
VSRAPSGSIGGAAADAYTPDRARVRRLADRAAPDYEDAAWLPRQVADALMEHLAPVRLAPARVLDAGAGTGICSRLLARRFPGARIVNVDSSAPMLQDARGRTRRWFSRHAFACGDAESLPLADGSVDLVVSSLMLPCCGSPDAVLAEFHRVLAPEGLLMFTSLGPDSLRELRESWMSVDPGIHVHVFLDMHDLGDALLRAGFRDVVMDVERFTGRYPDVAALTGELKRLGSSNAARGSRKGLMTPNLLAAMVDVYEQQRSEHSLPASFEVVFGHGWRAAFFARVRKCLFRTTLSDSFPYRFHPPRQVASPKRLS